MLALYRSGRQADALEAYRQARDVLVERARNRAGGGAARAPPGRSSRTIRGSTRATAARDAADGRGALPAPPNRTIGRGRRARRGRRAAASRLVRLLTLTGPGGVGKTRLALEAARRVEADFADGARFVSLDSVQRRRTCPPTIVKSLGIVLLVGRVAGAGGRALPGAPSGCCWCADNCEHVLGAAPFIGRLLAVVSGCHRACHQPRAARTAGRSNVAMPACRAAPAAQRRRGRAVRRARRGRTTRSSSSATATPARLRDLPPPRRAAAGDRARGRALRAAVAGRDRGAAGRPRSARSAPARATLPRASRRCGRRSTGATRCSTTTRRRASRASPSSPAARPSRRPRRSPAPTSTRSTASSPRACSCAARQRDGRRGSRCSRRSAPMPASASRRRADEDAVRERHYRYFLALARAPRHRAGALGRRAASEHLAALDADIDNLHAALGWAVAPERTPNRRSRCARRSGRYWLMRDRYAEAVRLDRPDAESRRRRRPSRAARPRALHEVLGPAPARARGEQAAVLAEAEAIARLCRTR